MSEATTPAPTADGGHGDHARKQIRGSSLIMAGRGISLGLNFLVQVLAVRYLSKTDYGAFAYALSAMELTARFVVLGMDRAASRFTAIYHEKQETAKVLGSIVLMIVTVIVVGLATVVASFGLEGLLGSRVVSDPLSLTLLLGLIILAPMEALNALLQAVFAVFVRPRLIFFRRYVVGPGLKLVAVLAVIALHGDVRMLAAVYVVAGVLGLLIGVALLWRVLGDAGLLATPRVVEIRGTAREILSFGTLMMISDVALQLRGTLVVLMLEFFRGTESVADFRAVFPAARLNRSVLESFGFLFMPLMTRLLVRKDAKATGELFWRSTLWVAVLSFPPFLATFSLAKPVIVLLFGERYADSSLILALLSLGFYVGATTGLNTMALRAAGKVRETLVLDVGAVVATFLLNVALLPRYGALGGAIGFLAVSVAQALAYQAVLAKVAPVRLMPREYAVFFLFVAGATAVVAVVQVLFAPPIWVGAALAVAASVAVVAAGGRLLDVAHTFPELLRVPLVRRFVRALEGRKNGETP